MRAFELRMSQCDSDTWTIYEPLFIAVSHAHVLALLPGQHQHWHVCVPRSHLQCFCSEDAQKGLLSRTALAADTSLGLPHCRIIISSEVAALVRRPLRLSLPTSGHSAVKKHCHNHSVLIC